MKQFIITMLVAIFAISASAKQSADTTVCFTVNPAMSCQNCENKIVTNLRYEAGVSDISASAKEGVVKVKFNPAKTSVDKLQKAFAKIGYTATPAKACAGKANAGKACAEKACAEKACAEKACAEKACAEKACTEKVCDGKARTAEKACAGTCCEKGHQLAKPIEPKK